MKIEKRLLNANAFTANISNTSVNEADRTATLIWSTGSKGLRSTGFGEFYEELAMTTDAVDLSRLQSGAPLLANHDASSLDSVIGNVQRAWLENGKGYAVVKFADDAKSDVVWQKVRQGILKNVSVGYRVDQMQDVSGKKDAIRTLRATKWVPFELSIVPIGFDQAAQIRSSKEQLTEVTILEGKFMQDENQNDESVKAALEERQRVQEINRLADTLSQSREVADDLISRGVSVKAARKEMAIKATEASTATRISGVLPATEIVRDEGDTFRQAFIDSCVKRINPNANVSPEAKLFQGASLIRSLERVYGRKLSEGDLAFATRALSTSDLPILLANVAEKSLRQEYMTQPQTFKPFVKNGTLRNYKVANRIILGDFPALNAINEHGEFKLAGMSESKETIQLARYGVSLQFTKELIINDDLNGVSEFANKAAKASARLESNLIYNSVLQANSGLGPVMSDGNNLFSSAHNNYTSSGTSISVASLTIGWNAIAKQKTLDGLDYLNLSAVTLICGPALMGIANQYTSNAYVASSSSNINPFSGKLNVVIDPRITGNGWYLAADPGQIDIIELARLEGAESPIVTVINDQTSPGALKIFCEHNVGASVLDYRGLYFNAGA